MMRQSVPSNGLDEGCPRLDPTRQKCFTKALSRHDEAQCATLWFCPALNRHGRSPPLAQRRCPRDFRRPRCSGRAIGNRAGSCCRRCAESGPRSPKQTGFGTCGSNVVGRRSLRRAKRKPPTSQQPCVLGSSEADRPAQLRADPKCKLSLRARWACSCSAGRRGRETTRRTGR